MTEFYDAPPPPRSKNRSTLFTDELLEDCRETPGKWTLAGNRNNTTQANYYRKRLPDFHIVTRTQDDGTHDYWIAYRGDDE